MLLFGAEKEELGYWITLITDRSPDIRLCVKHFLKQHYPDALSLVHTPDTKEIVVERIALPVQLWYSNYST